MAHPDAVHVPPHHARRMLAALIGGFSPDAIGADENLAAETVERALSDELGRRWTPTVAEFAKIQIARLEGFFSQLMDWVDAGELAAVIRALKMLDRLERYHGFQPSKPGDRDLWRGATREAPRQAQRRRGEPCGSRDRRPF